MNKLGESFNDGNWILRGIENIDKFLMRSLMDKNESIPSCMERWVYSTY